MATKNGKRIIACCDGTWVSSIGDKRYVLPFLILAFTYYSPQQLTLYLHSGPQSNVTRISRAFKRVCKDGKTQVILYDSGVGSSASKVDQIMGGAFGYGLEQNIREVYNFICNNYVKPDDDGYPGDDIILIGFSRGAFTARSVADLIATVGLLTNEGLDRFSDIFGDYENISDAKRDNFLTALAPFDPNDDDDDDDAKATYKAKWVKKRKETYLKHLIKEGYTTEPPPITAIAVFDTVGTLGIPPMPIFGIHGSAKQYKFSDTMLSPKVVHAFQALALDEPRYAFRPALWEKPAGSLTHLKQVWFPGNHGNIGGGWCDQQMADITLAWMVDQLANIGVGFRGDVLEKMMRGEDKLKEVFKREDAYARTHPYPFVPPSLYGGWGWYVKQRWPLPSWFAYFPFWRKGVRKWAVDELYRGPEKRERDTKDCTPECNNKKHGTTGEEVGRSWALGQIRFPDSFFQCITGSWVRTPARTVRVNPDTNKDREKEWLENTGERVHSSVRVRLACKGLGWDDHGVWKCEALTGNPTNGVKWQLRHVETPKSHADDELTKLAGKLKQGTELYGVQKDDWQWSWWLHPDCDAEPNDDRNNKVCDVRIIPEEPLAGDWERWLLKLHCGGENTEKDVWKWAKEHSLEVLG